MAKNGCKEGYTYYCGGEKTYPLSVLKFKKEHAFINDKTKYYHPT